MASEQVCSTQDHMRSRPHHLTEPDTAVTMQNRELPPWDPASPASSHLAPPLTGYFQTVHCVQLHLLEFTNAGRELPEGWRESPNLKKNKNCLCQKEAASSEAVVSNYEECTVTMQAFWWWWWWWRRLILCFSSPGNSTILFCFLFSPLLTPQCCQEIVWGNTCSKHNSRKRVSSQSGFQRNCLAVLRPFTTLVRASAAGLQMSELSVFRNMHNWNLRHKAWPYQHCKMLAEKGETNGSQAFP